MNFWPWIVLAGAVLFMTRKDTSSFVSRGMRNNNPGNIRKGLNWSGQVLPGTDPSFIQFKTMSYGLRALFIDLINKHKSGYDTIQKIIYRYAPPSENATSVYVNNVSSRSGIPALAVFQPTKNNFEKIAKAMAISENGAEAALIKDSAWSAGWNLAMERKDIASYIINA
jgi:hypothetical protein